VKITKEMSKEEFIENDLKLWRSYVSNGIVFEDFNDHRQIK
jgi:hypothetical protein